MSSWEEFLIWAKSTDPVDLLLIASIGAAVLASLIALLS